MVSQRTLVLNAVSDILTGDYIAFALFVVVIYDWVINLDKEVHSMWHVPKDIKPNAAALIYGLSRYPTILYHFFYLLTVFPMSQMACQINHNLQLITGAVVTLAPPIFSTIRVYVLSSRNKPMAILAFLLTFMPSFVSLILITMADKAVEEPKPFECSSVTPPTTTELRNRVGMAVIVCSITGDLVVVLLTWYKAYTSYRVQRRVLVKGSSLLHAMLHNGNMYFIVITGMNVLNIVFRVGLQLPNAANFARNANPPLTTILICHFLLDLQRAAGRVATAQTSSPSQVSSLNFVASSSSTGHGTLPAFIASMAADIHMDPPPVDSDSIGDDADAVPTDERGTGDAGPARGVDGDDIAMTDMLVYPSRDEGV